MTRRVASTLSSAVPDGASILAGLSGGVDSVVLLHVLALLAPRFSWKLSALHVHHGISPRADDWAAFCKKLCAQYGLPLHLEHVKIAPLRHLGVEAAARELRHAALARQQVDFIALAHHQDDQVETMLLQLLRGAGVKGAAAMPFVKRVAQHTPSPLKEEGWGEGDAPHCPVLLRPLLHCSRQEILDYAAANNLQWIEDESNADDSYPRNFLRHRVLPVLCEKFPAYRQTLARSTRHFAEAAELMETLAELDANLVISRSERFGKEGEPLLEIACLQSLGPARSKNLLRYLLCCRGVPMPDHSRMEEMLRQLAMAGVDGQICVAWRGWEVRSFRGRMYVCRSLPTPDTSLNIPWHGDDTLELPQLGGVLRFVSTVGEGISLAKLDSAPVSIQLRCGDEKLRPEANRPVRSLQYLFQERDVPPWQRQRWPLLYCGETLVAVPGIATAMEFQAPPGEAAIRPVWT